MSDIVKFPYSASRRVVARRPRRSKNGTPEERAAKLAPEAAPVPVIPRRSKNGTPEDRAGKASLGTVIDVKSRLASRAEAAQRRAQADRPMTKEEFTVAYNAATPSQQAAVRTMMEGALEKIQRVRTDAAAALQNKPNPPAA